MSCVPAPDLERPDMTHPTPSPVAARFVGQSVTRRKTCYGSGTRPVRRRRHRSPASHAAFFPATSLRPKSPGSTCRRRGPPGIVAVFTWQDFDGKFGEAYDAMLGEALVVPPPLAIGDVRDVGDPIVLVVAESRYLAEDAFDLIEVDSTSGHGRLSDRGARHRKHRPRGVGARIHSMVEAPFIPLSPTSTRRSPARRTSVETTVDQNRYVCVPMETGGSWRTGSRAGPKWTSCASCQSVHETRNFFARYLKIPEGQHPSTGASRGRWVRSEYVRRSRRVRRSARLAPGRPAGKLDRGTRRENLIGAPWAPPRHQLGTVEDRARRGPDDHRHLDRPRLVRRRLPHLPRGHRPHASARPLPGYRGPRFSMAMAWTNTMGKAAYRWPLDVRDYGARDCHSRGEPAIR